MDVHMITPSNDDKPIIREATSAVDELPTGALLRQTLDEAKELVRLEVSLARDELREELLQLKTAAILFTIGVAVAIVALALFHVAIVIALGNTATAALAVAFSDVAAVALLGFLGYRKLPKAPLPRTRERLTSDVRELKQHLVR